MSLLQVTGVVCVIIFMIWSAGYEILYCVHIEINEESGSMRVDVKRGMLSFYALVIK